MTSNDFLSKGNMKRILFLIFLIILMFAAIQNIGVLLGILGNMMDILFPFILGGALAFIFNVPMRRIEAELFKRKPDFKGKRAISYLLSLLFILGIIAVALFVIVPELIDTVKQLTAQIPIAMGKLQGLILDVGARYPELKTITKNVDLDYQSLINKAGELVGDLLASATGLLSSTVGIISSIFSGFVTFFIAFSFSIYILFRKEDLARQIKKVLFAFFPVNIVDKFLSVGELSNKTFTNFLTGQCLEACILGCMFFVAMSIFGMPYAILVSILIAITALIPIFGAFIGCGIGAVLILIENPKQALIFVIMFLIIQQIEGNLIYPHVVGGSVGLPSIWVLVAITVGGDLMGVVGMIIFIPLCSVVYTLFREFINNRLDKRGVPIEKYTLPYNEIVEFEKAYMMEQAKKAAGDKSDPEKQPVTDAKPE